MAMNDAGMRIPLRIMVALAVMVLAIFGQTISFDFIRFDEEQYVTQNPHVLSGLTSSSIAWAFTTLDAGFWHPLTWLSLMADAQLYGLHAGGYHGTNVLWHLSSTLLLFWVFLRMTGAPWRSGLVALLFAVHPLHVEPVAWIAARKDVLSTFFWILTMMAYVRYVERRVWYRYGQVLVCFALGLMAKPMLVTLPVILLLCDYWPLKRIAGRRVQTTGQREKLPFTRLLLEKSPLFVMAFLAGCLTMVAEQAAGAMLTLAQMSLSLRVGNAVWSYGLYLWKTVYPFNLAVFYPHPGLLPLWKLLPASILLVLLTGLTFRLSRSRPHLLVGWCWYIITLAPVSGILQVGSHAMADRYAYIPLIGPFIAASWESASWFLTWRCKQAIRIGLGGVVILVFAMAASLQVRHWQNSLALFAHALEVTEGNYLVHNNLGVELLARGNAAAAEEHYRLALRIKPTYAVTLNNMGNICLGRGQFDEAIRLFQQALDSNPQYSTVHRNLGDAYLRRGDCARAISKYKIALMYDNRDPEICNNLGIAWLCHGELVEAAGQFRRALQIKPAYSVAMDNLRKTEKALGR
jgi:protein O-mannosyl-transferase